MKRGNNLWPFLKSTMWEKDLCAKSWETSVEVLFLPLPLSLSNLRQGTMS